VPELSKRWGPESSPTFVMMLDRANQEFEHLHPSLAAAVEAIGAHQDAWVVQWMADLWTKRHPGA